MHGLSHFFHADIAGSFEVNGLGVADPKRTFFTFDCNPTGSDQKYAANQQACRVFARNHGIKVYDVDSGIGTHLAVDCGLVGPGDTIVSGSLTLPVICPIIALRETPTSTG